VEHVWEYEADMELGVATAGDGKESSEKKDTPGESSGGGVISDAAIAVSSPHSPILLSPDHG
jgi:hypothetical protein